MKRRIAMQTLFLCLGCLLMAAATSKSAFAQAGSRLNDKDVERTMNNLKEDTKKFRNSFKQALNKSTIRKTTREKDGKALADRFFKQTEGMLNHFKSKKEAKDQLSTVLSSARQLEELMRDVPLGSAVDELWRPVRSNLDLLSDAFGVTQ
jgi:hypothetical protein